MITQSQQQLPLDSAELVSSEPQNIVLFMGACLEPSSMCILFELCYLSLADLLYKDEPYPLGEPLPSGPTLRMLREVALGMHYLHSMEPPLLHLDL